MMTYLFLNIIVVLIVCVVFRIKIRRPSRHIITITVVICLLTLVFDSALVYFHVVSYNPSHILGLYVGLAPIEDYCYPLLAVIIIPFLWNKIGKKRDGSH